MSSLGAFILVCSAGLLAAACGTSDTRGPPAADWRAAVVNKGGYDPITNKNAVFAPQWRVGSKWLYSDGYGLEVTSVKAGVTEFTRTDAPKQWLRRRGFFREAAQSGTVLRKVVYRTVKREAGAVLRLGKPLVFTREYLSGRDLRVHVTSWTVEGREVISVPAGEFETWVLVMRTRSIKTDWTGFERWWYSPKVRNYVRMEYKYGNSEGSSRVLMSYSLAGETG